MRASFANLLALLLALGTTNSLAESVFRAVDDAWTPELQAERNLQVPVQAAPQQVAEAHHVKSVFHAASGPGQQAATHTDEHIVQSGVPHLNELKSALDAATILTRRAGKNQGAINMDKLRRDIQKGLTSLANSGMTAPETLRDLSQLVNPFIGTAANSNPGNVCPGASEPFGMVKITVDVDEYAPAGYTDDVIGYIRGLSLLHDSGTGSSAGSFGNFESLPIVCPNNDFTKCPTLLDDRKRFRLPGKDEASPGYFSLTLNNSIKLEATATRRAGLLRYTFPSSVLKDGKLPHIVQDWTNDLPGTFRGGDIKFDAEKGQIRLNGSWASSFGSGIYTYQAYSCFDLLRGGKQKLAKTGLWQGDRFGQDTKLIGATYANLTRNTVGGQPVQAGALYSFSEFPKNSQGDAEILIRTGVSFNSAEQACDNAQSEIGDAWDFDNIVQQTRGKWNEKFNRVEIDPKTDSTIAELVYSSLYYAFLTPNNATLEADHLFAGAKNYDGNYFNSLYCTWDTYRTFHPFLSLTSPVEMAGIVDNYIDGWRKNGWIPECRANNVFGLTQGGSHGVMVIADFLAKYHPFAKAGKLPVNIDDAYNAVYKDAYITPAEWDSYGRQVGVYSDFGYIPFGVFDTYSTGRQTREGSRTLEYAHNDFGARTVALISGKNDVADSLGKRSLNYQNVFDKNTKSLGFDTFVQQRRPDGSFRYVDPTTCSPIDNNSDHACSLQQENNYGVYETSAWEYSLYAPHDTQGLIQLLVQNDTDKFIKRVDTFFDKDLYYAGNEPSFQTPVIYHYANRPTKSVQRVRQVVYRNFNTTTAGIPGNSDQGAMQTLLLFHLLGLYPVPATREFLIVSPFLPSYRLRNPLLGDLIVKVTNFDATSLKETIPKGSRAYVSKVLLNGQEQSSRCKIQFEQLFPSALNADGQKTETTLELVMTDRIEEADSCGATGKEDLPSSLSTGGFASF